MRKIFDEAVSHIIPSNDGYYMITAQVDSEVYYVSKDNKIRKIEAYNKATYVYECGKDNIFVPSMYYRAYGYICGETRKYRTKSDLIEWQKECTYYNNCVYYYTAPLSSDAKIWKLDLDTGINEEIKLDIPKKRGCKVKYSYINIEDDQFVVIYFYFREKAPCYGEMFIRVYKDVDGSWVIMKEKQIEVGVRGIHCVSDGNCTKKVLLFDKVCLENDKIRPCGQYIAVLDKECKLNKIFDIPDDYENFYAYGVDSYVILWEKRMVILKWRSKLLVYDMDTGNVIDDLTLLLAGAIREVGKCFKIDEFSLNSVCMFDEKLIVATTEGVLELEEKEYCKFMEEQ